MKVFLGGTCTSKWRDELIPMLKIDYFNPVVEDWTPECQQEELKQRKDCDFCLYVITPKLAGFYSIAEVVDDSNKRPKKTILCVLEEDGDVKFSDKQMKSFLSIRAMVVKNGGIVFCDLKNCADYLNNKGGKGELCDLLVNRLKEYKKTDVLKSIKRNNHMNEYDGEEIKETTIDAILVDFINYVACSRFIDLGLYTKDLKGEQK